MYALAVFPQCLVAVSELHDPVIKVIHWLSGVR